MTQVFNALVNSKLDKKKKRFVKMLSLASHLTPLFRARTDEDIIARWKALRRQRSRQIKKAKPLQGASSQQSQQLDEEEFTSESDFVSDAEPISSTITTLASAPPKTTPLTITLPASISKAITPPTIPLFATLPTTTVTSPTPRATASTPVTPPNIPLPATTNSPSLQQIKAGQPEIETLLVMKKDEMLTLKALHQRAIHLYPATFGQVSEKAFVQRIYWSRPHPLSLRSTASASHASSTPNIEIAAANIDGPPDTNAEITAVNIEDPLNHNFASETLDTSTRPANPAVSTSTAQATTTITTATATPATTATARATTATATATTATPTETTATATTAISSAPSALKRPLPPQISEASGSRKRVKAGKACPSCYTGKRKCDGSHTSCSKYDASTASQVEEPTSACASCRSRKQKCDESFLTCAKHVPAKDNKSIKSYFSK
ncbi:hypothetical protein DFS34DRAFT_698685 [Phlyctochytrium arcticum]|nr:hypothetical protein DFS34DRAFT_698685 [Phlyctochytrium arcticum]